jgi:predicted RNase H-like HicB family nuclease
MRDSARYITSVAWSEEDQCYVGSAPGLLEGGRHGDDERQVFAELCQIVEEVVDLYRQGGKPLPAATFGNDWPGRLQKAT